MRVCRFVMVKPAQLNSSAAALAGSGVLSLTKSPFQCKTLADSTTVTLQLHILTRDVTMDSLVSLLGTVVYYARLPN